MKKTRNYLLATTYLLISCLLSNKVLAQCDCPYPIIFVHGWTSDFTAFQPVYTDADFMDIWGPLSDTPDAVLNANSNSSAFGIDGMAQTIDDDMLFHVQFVNRSTLAPGCIYAVDWDWQWDEDINNPNITTNGSFPNTSGESDSNQSSIEKQGYALGETIKAVLAANPTKNKVILMGHSMGGLASREYLQRVENGTPTWWVDPTDPVNGHKVAKVITVGTPHRGSNASAAGLGGLFGFDERSEAVRDLRFSYYAGLFSSRKRAPYLFSGAEDDDVLGTTRDSYDVDCDGDVDTNPITGINSIGVDDPWDGTSDNPIMPLPTNIKYTYYSSYSVLGVTLNGGDGVVDLERQWIYNGGDGKLNSYQNGSSIPAPSDGVAYRLSDRLHSEDQYFHSSQTQDINNMVRILDEGDYPFFAYDIDLGVDYAGISQKRADFVPLGSEYSGGANDIDGDWFVFETTQAESGFDITITPNPNKAGRIDFYEGVPSAYSNANAPTYSDTWGIGQSAFVLAVSSNSTCFQAGSYYVRITHEGLTNDSWKTPYKFRINPQACPIPNAPLAMIDALSATLSWDGAPCANQYILDWRAVGESNWNSTIVVGITYELNTLLPGTDYEFRVRADCNPNTSNFSVIVPFSTEACPTNLYIPSAATIGQVSEGVYNVGMEITSDGAIATMTTVTYHAGNTIQLLPGFEVKAGADFLAQIQTCTASIQTEIVATDRSNDDTRNLGDLDKESPLTKTFVSWKEALKKQTDLYFRIVPKGAGIMELEYYLDKNRVVNLALTNGLKQQVVTIVNQEKKNKGWHRFLFNTNALTSDVYLVDFTADDLHLADKIVLGTKLTTPPADLIVLENKQVAQVQVYPNPFNNWLSITLAVQPLKESIQLKLFDATGRIVQTTNLQEIIETISVESLPSGFYFYKIEGASGEVIDSGRLVK